VENRNACLKPSTLSDINFSAFRRGRKRQGTIRLLKGHILALQQLYNAEWRKRGYLRSP